tara:strand:- start:347 stop:520 length:174 start_codon:yes stop_codon:yes gene_type:complete
MESDDILEKILERIKLERKIKYIPKGDGEQNYTIFYKEYYPFIKVCKKWRCIIKKKI